jgi:hypothetical protein
MVDRASLDAALDWRKGVFRYEVLPDRVVFYLWPTGGGSRFSFRFRPRLAMLAKTTPSALYDYYNPEAIVVLEPVTFEVRND